MKCAGCASEIPDGVKFCTKCGAPAGETTQMPVVTPVPQAPVPPVAPDSWQARPPGEAPPPQTYLGVQKQGKQKAVWIAVIIILVFLLLGGGTAGIIIWRVAASNRTIAEVRSVELSRSDGEDVDLDAVPLDMELALEATFRARFREGGKARLKLAVVDNEGSEIASKSWSVTSSDKLQVKTLKYSMESGSGKPIEARAELRVTRDGKTTTGDGSLTFKSVEGEGNRIKFEKARDRAKAKLQEAINASKEIIGMGIDAADIVQQLDENVKKLDAATTEAEANETYAAADAILAECARRKAAFQDTQARQQDIDACEAVMLAYARANKGTAEDVWLEDFSMNDARTNATATVAGMITVHTDPENAGTIIRTGIGAEKQNGQWVVTYFGSGE